MDAFRSHSIHVDSLNHLRDLNFDFFRRHKQFSSMTNQDGQKLQVYHIHPKDNVATAFVYLDAGTHIRIGLSNIVVRTPIPFGHKIAVRAIYKGEPVIKYGETIGLATKDIEPGDHVHSHNMVTVRGIQTKLEE